MKFHLTEIKMWFKDNIQPPRSFRFLPNKINVITGDSTTGKSSLMQIIDYCFLSEKVKIVEQIINENIEWYGVSFNLEGRCFSIARKAPKEIVSAAVHFSEQEFLNEVPKYNIEISELRSKLDGLFILTDELRQLEQKNKSMLGLSFRHFLLFNLISEDIITDSKVYLDVNFFSKEKYEKTLKHLFLIAIGVDDLKTIRIGEQIKAVEREIKKIENQVKKERKSNKTFETGIDRLIRKCKEHNFLDLDMSFLSLTESINFLENVVSEYIIQTNNEQNFSEREVFVNSRNSIKSQINSITRLETEYNKYCKNLDTYADSLIPITYIKSNLADVIESHETQEFLNSLENSLNQIKINLKPKESFTQVKALKILKKELEEVELKINALPEIQKAFPSEASKYITIGEIKSELNFLKMEMQSMRKIDPTELHSLKSKKDNLELQKLEQSPTEESMKVNLNKHINRNFKQLNAMPTYSSYDAEFVIEEMILKLKSPEECFPLENVGSKSNWMLLHLCFFLGLHEHMIHVKQEHVPQFLFIDQPSIPYYQGDSKKNNDKDKLMDAFRLLNSFIDYVVKEQHDHFQILLIEHASKKYWKDNDLTNFHTVAEFINGEGLIPRCIYE